MKETASGEHREFESSSTQASYWQPVILFSIGFLVSTMILMTVAQSNLDKSGRDFHAISVDQLSTLVSQSVTRGDLLSLNVLVSEFVARQQFIFISVYSADQRLLAQAGKQPGEETLMLSRDITSQNTIVGHVQVAVRPGPSIYSTGVLVLMVVIWSTGVFFIVGFFRWGKPFINSLIQAESLPEAPDDQVVKEDKEEKVAETSTPAKLPGNTTVLTLRITPARLAGRCEPLISDLQRLYGGQLEDSGRDETIISFNQRDHPFQAICTALLTLKTLLTPESPIQVKIGLSNSGNSEQLAEAIKQGRYLASLSNNQIVASRLFIEGLEKPQRVMQASFHHAGVRDGDVFEIYGLAEKHEKLLVSQAGQLKNHHS